MNSYGWGMDVIKNSEDEIIVISSSDRNFHLIVNHFEPMKEDPILNYLQGNITS